ncbi:MAG TPA: DUF4831 family protein [Bacteroidia bacterium]|nr:DUF4831 family protein [Bacteroidia bacterium]
MKPIKYILLSAFLFTCFNACVTSVPVYNVAENKHPKNGEGLYYALPKNVITADITITRTQITEAPFGKFADSLLALEYKPGVTFEIEETKIASYSVVDSAEWYFVDLRKNGVFKKVSVSMTVGENGILSNSSAEVENKTIDYAIETIEFVATVAGKIIPFGNPVAGINSTASENFQSDDKEKPKTLLDSALNVIKQLNDIESRRIELISNTTKASVSAEALQIMLKELDAKKKELLSLFVGIKKIKKITLRFENETINDSTLFTFSEKAGLSGLPASMNIDSAFLPKIQMPGANAVTIRFSNAQFLPVAMKNSDPVKKTSSFYYRIPANTTVQVWQGSKILTQTEMLIAQKGVVKSLPMKTGGMKTKYELKYDPKTGALLEIKMNGEPISDETIENATKVGEKVIDVIKPDELSELEKQRKILEEKKKIEELQQAK